MSKLTRQYWRTGFLMRTRFLALLALCACSKPNSPAPGAGARAETAVPVLLRPVKTQPVQVEVGVNGTFWGDEDVSLSAKVSGRVLEVARDLGDRLGSGELLARIDPLDYAL